MKKIIVILLTLIIICNLAGCGAPATPELIERKQVDAIVVDTWKNVRNAAKYVRVAYDGALTDWYDETGQIYEYCHLRHGEKIPCYLIIYTYESGMTSTKLMFNQNLWDERMNNNED